MIGDGCQVLPPSLVVKISPRFEFAGTATPSLEPVMPTKLKPSAGDEGATLADCQALPPFAEYSISVVVASTTWPLAADVSDVGVPVTVTLPARRQVAPSDDV